MWLLYFWQLNILKTEQHKVHQEDAFLIFLKSYLNTKIQCVSHQTFSSNHAWRTHHDTDREEFYYTIKPPNTNQSEVANSVLGLMLLPGQISISKTIW